jgi:hypothetical protein
MPELFMLLIEFKCDILCLALTWQDPGHADQRFMGVNRSLI